MAEVPLPLILGMALVAAGTLVPNHYLPWTSFHSELTSAVGFAIIVSMLVFRSKGSIACSKPTFALLALALVPTVQAAFGVIHFGGDAVMASLYLVSMALAFAAGRALVGADKGWAAAATMWTAWLVAAIVSVGIALYQWLGLGGLGTLAMDIAPSSRPYANLAQPNHLATVLLMALVATAALFEARVVGRASTFLCVSYLTFGLAATQSRSAWLSAAVLVVGAVSLHKRASLRLSRSVVIAWAAGFAALVLVWPALCEAIYLLPGRTLSDQTSGGTRAMHWGSMVDAIVREPWRGYGWNQVSVAQARVATDHPFTGNLIEHSHNLVLDLLVWNGIPLGVAVIAALVWWMWTRFRACRDSTTAMLLLGIVPAFVHAMVEFPLEYAYFLLPVALLMGMADARVRPDAVSFKVPVLAARGAVVLVLLTLIATAVEYLRLEQAHRDLRMRSAGIGDPAFVYEEPDGLILTQLLAFLEFAKTPATEDMPGPVLDRMHIVAERYGYPPVLFRYALATALNGRPDAARDAMIRLCRTHSHARCTEGLEAWQGMIEGRYPQLRQVDISDLEP